ncbi:MAG: DUF412 domain-containing protein [Colwellia sp.]|nr:DUF412 domain-containing protein [Colwellia sp.]
MNMSVVDIIKLGRKYMNLWPQRIELANYFSEYRVVQVGRFACRYLPGLAVFIFIMQLYLGSIAVLPQAVVYSLFILSIPVQALVTLGVKADKFLPPGLASWYKEGVAKVNEGGGEIKLSVLRPRYLDLAKLLNITYTSMAAK